MTAMKVTFIGGEECGNIGSTTWGNETTGTIEFHVNQPVIVDPDAAQTREEEGFLRHVLKKAATNRFFKTEEVGEDKGAARASVKQRVPKAAGRKPKADSAEADADTE